MKMRMRCVYAALFFAAAPAFALDAEPPAPPVRSAAPAKPEPARAAFEALPAADREALQEALGWLGFYNGVVDGHYGKRSEDALIAWQKSIAARGDGVITSAQLAALKAGAAKAKAAVGFKLVDDAATGIRIGAPLKMLDKRESVAGEAAYKSADGAVGLYLKATSGDLATLFKTLSADSANRKVTYKYLKRDGFFVAAGEEGEAKFYRRYAAAPGEAGKLRGFAFLYPKARAAALDPVALAITNSFEPFPTTPAAPTPSPTPETPKLTATALDVAPGVALSALDSASCKAPLIGGKPARFLAPQGALTRLGG